MHLIAAGSVDGEEVVEGAIVDPPAIQLLNVCSRHCVCLAAARLTICKDAHIEACAALWASLSI